MQFLNLRIGWVNQYETGNVEKYVFEFASKINKSMALTEWMLCNSSYDLEAEAFKMNPKILPIGPLLAIGYQFDPTDQKLIFDFLYNKVHGNLLPSPNPVIECDVYGDGRPWGLFEECEENALYFFTRLKNKNVEKADCLSDGCAMKDYVLCWIIKKKPVKGGRSNTIDDNHED
ncbi:hypothetical protein Dsin_011682 [Dipteronia sinensis]|uniref:NAC domain-containing protein n=1 Tax=Dipteronia sinensis TaxID=43782 RepID=A0AAE0AGQ7_9ROSI|nr:hypothetical protein Dsin_011682 [Dipteronia sinensis]